MISIFATAGFTLLALAIMVAVWVIAKEDYNKPLMAIWPMVLILFIIAIMWTFPFTPATPYSNEENIARYEILKERLDYIKDNPNSPYFDELYNEIKDWNAEYTHYQSMIGNIFDKYCYPADRYEGCSEINFWEEIK